MTDLDVALRVRLAYDGAGAKAAIGDMKALGSEAVRVGASASAAAADRKDCDLDRSTEAEASPSRHGRHQTGGEA